MHVKITVASLVAVLLLMTTLMNPSALFADAGKKVNTDGNNLAIKGYDPVAYFTEKRPTAGRSEYAYSWSGALWRFANAKHRDMFARDPERYAPQFGGHCSMALARGKIKDIDPEAWVIVDDKLYLNFSKPVLKTFQDDIKGNIRKAEANWNKLQK